MQILFKTVSSDIRCALSSSLEKSNRAILRVTTLSLVSQFADVSN